MDTANTNGSGVWKVISWLVLILIMVAGVYFFLNREDNSLAEERLEGMEVSEISSEGQVQSMSADGAVILATRLERTEEGNKPVDYERNVTFAQTIQFQADGEVTEVVLSNLGDYLRVRDRAVFYGTGDLVGGVLLVNRIDLISRGTAEFELTFPE